MRALPLTAQQGGINRLRVKGAASAATLYDLQNGYISNAGTIVPREGTIRVCTLDGSTVGLAAAGGKFNIFSSAWSTATLPANYVLNVLSNPTNSTASPTIIWYAKPFMGFPYVVAEFNDSSVWHYWLQNNGTWTSTTDYTSASIVLPPTANGLAYQGVRDFAHQPLWTANTVIASASCVEPNVPNGFCYEAINATGSPIRTGGIEPTWPTVAGAVIQEFGDFDLSTTDQGTVQVSGGTLVTASPLGATITDRYGDSNTISNAGTLPTSSTLSTLTLASTKVTTWLSGTHYVPGAVVVPTVNQGGFLNAIPNGDFEQGNVDWTYTDIGGATAWTISGTRPDAGTYSLELVGGSSIGADGAYATMTTGLAVTAGRSVTLSGYLDPNNNGADLNLWLALRWYDKTATFISNTLSAPAEGGGYRPVSVTGIAPAGAVTVKAAVRAGSGTTSRNSGFADNLTWNLEIPAALSNFLFEAVNPLAGTSAATEPSWPTVLGNTVVDGGVTWKAIGTSIISWQAIPLMQSGTNAPVFPTTVGSSVWDSSSFKDANGYVIASTGMHWLAVDRHVADSKNPQTTAVVAGASHIFAGDADICDYSAAVNPIDWSSTNNAGYLPTGINNYGDNPVAMLALYRSNLMVFNAGGYQMWQIDPDPQNMALLDAQPVGSIYPRAAQSVANDLLFLTEVGVRNLGTVGATANMQIGNTGQPVDPLIMAALNNVPVYAGNIADPYFANVGALLFMTGTNGSTTFTDSGPGGVTVTNTNGATITTANAPSFEPVSAFFASTGFPSTDMYLSLPIVPGGPLDLSTGDYTIEGWLYGHSQDGSGGGGAGTFLSDGAGVSTPGPNQLLFNPSSKDIEGAGSSIFNGAYITSANVILNQWQSFAFVRSGSTTTAYMNGVGGTPVASTFTVTTGSWHIGSALRSLPFWGWLSNIRITKGVARYTSNYTPVGPLGAPVKYVTTPANLSQYPMSLYYPGRGQYWLIFGPQAFVLTMNGSSKKTWSRYTFPDSITDWTLNAGILYLRSKGNLVWQIDATTTVDDASSTLTTQGTDTGFPGVIQWPYLDFGKLGGDKMLVGVDLVGDGTCNIQIGFNQTDKTTFNDNTNFVTSTGVTAPYTILVDDTVANEPIPIPLNGPSFSLVLTFPASTIATPNAWTWEAANLYIMDAPIIAGGSTG